MFDKWLLYRPNAELRDLRLTGVGCSRFTTEFDVHNDNSVYPTLPTG